MTKTRWSILTSKDMKYSLIMQQEIEIAKSNKELWSDALQFTKSLMSNEESLIQELFKKNPDTWWAPYHFFTMMSFRNQLRQNFFGETQFKITNLDNIYIELIEEAFNLK